MRLFWMVVLVCALQLSLGCMGSSSEEPTSDSSVEQLERDMGGPAGLLEFLSTASEEDIRWVLESYGMGYEVHEATEITNETIDKNIADCPQFFPASDRNVWHAFNGEYYYVDGAGRPERTYAYMPPIASESRQTTCQTNVGRWGDAENPSNDYDGGHMIGSQLGGWGGRANLVPQDLNFNRGNWVQLENRMAMCDGLPSQRMFYSVRVGYPNGSSLIPNTFSLYLEDRVEGDNVSLSFQNTDYGGSNGTSERTRGVNFLSAQGCN